MINFRLQHPEDLISRIMVLDYFRKLGAAKVYEKTDVEMRKKYFYKFLGEDDKEAVDYNWENLLFNIPLYIMEDLISPFEKEIEEINRQELEHLKKLKELREEENVASISIYDIAKAEIEKSKDKSRLLLTK